jgi:PAP2 superfamily
MFQQYRRYSALFINWFPKMMGRYIERLREDRWLYCAIAAYTGFGLAMLRSKGREDLAAYGLYMNKWTFMFLYVMPSISLGIDALLVLVRVNKRRLLGLRRIFAPQKIAHLLGGCTLLMGLMVFQGTFTSIKTLLPILRGGFPFDRMQADLDVSLHFGYEPWMILYAVGRNATIRTIVEWNYDAGWFILNFGLLFYVATSPKARRVRWRYIGMFMLVWAVCGNLLAGIFLSAGPAFYGLVTGDTARYADQLAFLAASDWANSAVSYQRYLWTLYDNGTAGFGSGISAFPSVHVGMVAMNAFFASELSRRLAVAAFAYLAFVAASSVYLAWHYAIDGYVAVITVGVCHFGLRKLTGVRGARLVSVSGGGAPASAVRLS